jgi:integrase
MRSQKSIVPAYRQHKASGQAVVTLNGVDFYLGDWKSESSRAKYDRLVGEWINRGRRLPNASDADGGRLIKEVIVGYYSHIEATLPAVEVEKIKPVLTIVKKMYGELPAAQFNAISYAAIRLKLVESGRMTPGRRRRRPRDSSSPPPPKKPTDPRLCVSTVRARLGAIRRMIAWGVSREMIPDKVPNLIDAFEKAEPLRVRTGALKPVRKIKPAPEEHINAILPHLNPTVRAMVELQFLTGARGGEIWRLTTGQIDRSAEPWVYEPATHKTAEQGKDRFITFGPRAQEIVKCWLKADPGRPLFSPIEATEAQYAKRRAERVTPMTPSQRARKRKDNPQVKPRAMYDKNSYKQAIERACIRAGVPVFRPHQIRHCYATKVRRDFGPEAAQVMLGHSRIDTTERYAEKNLAIARDIAAKIG